MVEQSPRLNNNDIQTSLQQLDFSRRQLDTVSCGKGLYTVHIFIFIFLYHTFLKHIYYIIVHTCMHALHYIALHCIALHYIRLHYITLHIMYIYDYIYIRLQPPTNFSHVVKAWIPIALFDTSAFFLVLGAKVHTSCALCAHTISENPKKTQCFGDIYI